MGDIVNSLSSILREEPMARSAETTRRRILDAAYVLFRRKGFSRVNVDEIAAAAEITKRTLYSHIRSKDELLAAVLESQHRLAFDAFQTFGKKLSGTPAEIINALFNELSVWSAKPQWVGSGFTRLVMELADLPGHPARSIAKRHKAVLEVHLAGRLEQAGIASPRDRARELCLLSEGAMVLLLIHGDRRYIHTAAEAARKLLSGRDKMRA
jgi:AcrR family transcriptional regulator